MARDVHQEIDEIVSNNRVVLFMKGSKMMPQCGFSARALQAVGRYTNEFQTVNVLADNDVREGVKTYSNWPTIPQLYVDGQFIGGSDIVAEMDESGELGETIGATGEEARSS